MPSKSKAQHKLMLAASKSKKFAEEIGIDQKVAAEFVEADRKAGLWQDDDKDDKKKGKKK